MGDEMMAGWLTGTTSDRQAKQTEESYWEGYEAPTQIQQDRLWHLIDEYPQEARKMRESGELEGYLARFQESADRERRSLMRLTPTSVGWAYVMAGATQELRTCDPAEWLRLSKMAPFYADEYIYSELVQGGI